MSKREAETPFFRILTNAFQYANKNQHPQVTPFEVLVALMNDHEAEAFFANSPFDFEELKKSVQIIQSYYEEQVKELLKNMNLGPKQKLVPIYPPQTIMTCAQAKERASELKTSGFAELLEGLARCGDENVFEAITGAEIKIKEIADFVVNQKKAGKDFKKAAQNEIEKLKNLAPALKLRVFDQEEAIDTVARAVLRAKAGLKDPEKPVGSFLFTGKTGVGKTALALELGEYLGVPVHRFDMSEYMESHEVARLIGAPPGYIGHDKGGELTNKVQQTPECIVLLDEIEKAHPAVFNALLQIMDAGRMTDGKGTTVKFNNVILVMSSNIGANIVQKSRIGFGSADQKSLAKQAKLDFERAVKDAFSPEFRNRLDATVTFGDLKPGTIRLVAQKFLSDLNKDMLAPKGVELVATPAAVDALAAAGFDPDMGARPMKRTINEVIKTYLADEMLFGALQEGGKVELDIDAAGNYKFTIDGGPAVGPLASLPAPEVDAPKLPMAA